MDETLWFNGRGTIAYFSFIRRELYVFIFYALSQSLSYNLFYSGDIIFDTQTIHFFSLYNNNKFSLFDVSIILLYYCGNLNIDFR